MPTNHSTWHLYKPSGKIEWFTKKEISAAKLAPEFQRMIFHPSKRDLKSMVSNNMIQNFPIISSGSTNSCSMFGTTLTGTKVNKV